MLEYGLFCGVVHEGSTSLVFGCNSGYSLIAASAELIAEVPSLKRGLLCSMDFSRTISLEFYPVVLTFTVLISM